MEDFERIVEQNWMRRKLREQRAADAAALEKLASRQQRCRMAENCAHALTGSAAVVTTAMVLVGALVPALIGVLVTVGLYAAAKAAQILWKEAAWRV